MDATLCVGIELGDQVGVGEGISMPQREHKLWIAPQLSPELGWNITESLRVFAAIEAAFPLYRHHFVIAPYGEVFRSERVAVRGGIGLEWLFATESAPRPH